MSQASDSAEQPRRSGSIATVSSPQSNLRTNYSAVAQHTKSRNNREEITDEVVSFAHSSHEFEDGLVGFPHECSFDHLYHTYLPISDTQPTTNLGQNNAFQSPTSNAAVLTDPLPTTILGQYKINALVRESSRSRADERWPTMGQYQDSVLPLKDPQAGSCTLATAHDVNLASRSASIITTKIGVPFESHVPYFPDGPDIHSPSLTLILEEDIGHGADQFPSNKTSLLQFDEIASPTWHMWDTLDSFCTLPNEQGSDGWVDPALLFDSTTLPHDPHPETLQQQLATPLNPRPKKKAKFIPPRKWSSSRLRELACRDRPRNLPESVDWDMKAYGANIQEISIQKLWTEDTVASGSFPISKEGEDGMVEGTQSHTVQVAVGSREALDPLGRTKVPFRAIVVNELDEIVLDITWMWDGTMSQLVEESQLDTS